MAGRIPAEILTEIQQRADIVDIVGEYVTLRRRGRNWFGLCPFHQEDTPSFSVNQEKQIFKCFGCGKGGNVIGFIQEVEHLSFGEAARKLADRYHIAIPEEAISPEESRRLQQRRSLLAIHELAAKFFQEQLETSAQAGAYLKRRGISPEMVERFGLGYSPEADWQALHQQLSQAGFGEELQLLSGLVSKSSKNGRCYDKFHGRLIFPIRSAQGQVVAFGGRALGEEQPKYLNSQTTPIYNKSQLLFGLDLAGTAISQQKQVIIMEGYMDVLTAHQYGVENAVASLGTAFTPEQARLLSRYAPGEPEKMEVLLSFDGDGAGAKAALLSLDKLSACPFAEAKVLVYPEQKDPDEFLRTYGQKGWQRLLERYCYSRLDYLLYRAMQRHDPHTAQGKGAIVADLVPAILATDNYTEAEDFIHTLSRRLQVSEQAIRLDVTKGRPKPKGVGTVTQVRPRVSPAEKESFSLAQKQLLLLSLSNREIFQQAYGELGEEMAPTALGKSLLQLVLSLGETYTFQPSSLFNYLPAENEGLRDFLLKLLDTDIPETGQGDLAAGYIRTIRQQSLSRQMAALQQKIAAAQDRGEDCTPLIEEKLRLKQQQMHLGEQYNPQG